MDSKPFEDKSEEAWTALANRCEAWKDLARALDDLCVCYRLGKRPADKTLDRIRQLKERLGYDR